MITTRCCSPPVLILYASICPALICRTCIIYALKLIAMP